MGLHRCRTALLLSSLDLKCAEMYWVYLCPVWFWMVTLSSCNWYDNMAQCVTLCVILCWCLPFDCCWNIVKMTKTPQHYLKISQAQFGGIMSQRATERTRTHMHAEINILKKRLQGVACPMSFQGPSLPKYKKDSKDSTGMSRHKYLYRDDHVQRLLINSTVATGEAYRIGSYPNTASTLELICTLESRGFWLLELTQAGLEQRLLVQVCPCLLRACKACPFKSLQGIYPPPKIIARTPADQHREGLAEAGLAQNLCHFDGSPVMPKARPCCYDSYSSPASMNFG